MSDPKTTIGGLVIVACVGLLWTHSVTVEQAISLMGLAAGWVGWQAKDGGKQ